MLSTLRPSLHAFYSSYFSISSSCFRYRFDSPRFAMTKNVFIRNGGTQHQVMTRHSVVELLRQGGLFSVVKPKGITSAALVNQLKPIILAGCQSDSKKKSVKVGHGGTLDMFASGVLVIGVGHGTKLLGKMLHGNKKYTVMGCLGIATNTMDAGGQITDRAVYDHISLDDIKNSLHQFRGSILQVPPIFSALKVQGRRMSDLAYSGMTVEPKPARQVMVHDLRCIAFDPPYFHLDVACGGGFYVRKLVHDVGYDLGSYAHVTELCRTQQGPFHLEHALEKQDWTLDNIIKSLSDAKQEVKDDVG